MKILHITNYIYPHIGGIEQTSRDIINSLCDAHEQRVICFNSKKGDAVDEVDGVPVVRCSTALKISSQAISFSFQKRLKEQFKQFQPQIVVFHYPNPFEAHYLLKCLKKYPSCKLVLWWHLDITKQKILGKLFKGQSKQLLRCADKIIATSPNYVKSSPFLSCFSEKCVIIPSCINHKRLAMTSKDIVRSNQIRNENRDKTICFAVGRHVEYKGFRYLIKASALLGQEFKLYIGGEGELTPELKRLAKDDDKIKFLGKLSDEELKAYLSACDIYCFPSITKNEAFGLALAEAMSFGKPAVTFTIEGSGVNYVSLNGVTGIEVENGNAEKFSDAIKTLSKDIEARNSYGAAAKQRVNNLFSQSVFNANVKHLLEEI